MGRQKPFTWKSVLEVALPQYLNPMKKTISLCFFLLALSLFGGNYAAQAYAQAKPVNHAAFDQQLKKFVSPSGSVNYKAWRQDRPALQAYLKLLSDNAPTSKWTKEEQLA